MAMTINTNVTSLNAQRNLRASASTLSVAMQRLSSGLRVNSAKDDAAGLAISERMRAQINGLSVAARNANDGISLAQTAEGALGKVGDMLQRMRELAVQSANATNSDNDRQALQSEVGQLRAEIDRVAKTTSFNGQKLLDGSFAGALFQVGPNAGDHLTVAGLANTKTAQLGNVKFGSSASTTVQAAGISLYGQDIAAGTLRIQYGAGKSVELGAIAAASSGEDRLRQVVAAINATTAETSVTAYLTAGGSAGEYQVQLRSTSADPVAFSGFTEVTTGVGRALTTSYAGSDAAHIRALQDAFIQAADQQTVGTGSGTLTFAQALDIRSHMDAIAGPGDVLASDTSLFDDSGSGFSGVFWDYVMTLTDQLAYTAAPTVPGDWNDATGWLPGAESDQVFSAVNALHSSYLQATTNVQRTQMQGVENAFTALASASDSASFQSAVANLQNALGAANVSNTLGLTLDPAADLQAAIAEAISNARSLTEGGFGITLADITSDQGLEGLDIGSQSGAWKALLSLDSAIDQISAARGQLGALQSRFENIVQNIGITHENLSAARGRIIDADYAAETATLSRSQILQQVGIAMVAQANQLPQNVLQLLR